MAAVNTFKSAVTRIRDILRGPGVSITGMDSMHHICIYLMSRFVTRKRGASLRVPDEFTWEALIEGFKKNGGTQNALDVFYHEHEDCLVKHFYRLFGTEKHRFDLTDEHKHREIIEILNEVDMERVECEIDILGWVYEQHLSTGSSSACRDLGQFFTMRKICMYMIQLCAPCIKDGVPESVCDPTMGTGGFLTAYVKYFKKHFPDAAMDWSKQIHGCDTDTRVAALCGLNLFMETGGTCMTNVLKHDSLYGGLASEYDVILANMPFGLKGIKYENCCDRVTALGIKGNKSEPLFLQLMMASLKMGGRCAVVVPDGMILNISACHNKTRKYLLDNFEVRRVIKLKGKLFMNTGIQPSIIFFERTGKPTEVVEFWVKDEGETMVAAVPRSKLNDTCSFDVRRYLEAPTALSEFPLVTLSSVLQIVGGKQNSERSEDLPVPYYDSNGIVGHVAEPLYCGCYIITARKLSIGAVHYVNGPFYPSDNTINLTTLDAAVLSNRFFYYWLLLNNHILMDLSAGIKPGIRKSDVAEIKMPLPPLTVQDEIVATLERVFSGTTELADTLRMTDKAMDLVLAAPDGATLEPIVAAQRLIRKSAQMAADIKAQMAALVKASCSSKFPSVTLSNVCKVSFGDRITQKEHMGTIYPVYGSGGETFKTDHFNRTGLTCKIGRFALSESNMVMMVHGPYWLMDSGFTVESKEPDIMTTSFLWYCLRMDKKRLATLSAGSCQKNIDMASFYEVEYHCPPIVVQEEVLARLDALQTQLTALESLQRQSEDNARFILQSYLE